MIQQLLMSCSGWDMMILEDASLMWMAGREKESRDDRLEQIYKKGGCASLGSRLDFSRIKIWGARTFGGNEKYAGKGAGNSRLRWVKKRRG